MTETKISIHAPKFGVTSSEISNSVEYKSFRSSVPSRKLLIDDDDTKVWRLYDAGPKSVVCPLICLPPVSGTADVYFRQILSLTSHGYRVIAIDYPVYWSVIEFCTGFKKLLDHLGLDQVHLFGCSLGGFLAQKFAEFSINSNRVHSLILCNTFSDTKIFQYNDSAMMFWLMPALLLKRILLNNFPKAAPDIAIAHSIDFVVELLENLTQREIASRLTLNCVSSEVDTSKLLSIPITILDVFDYCALTEQVRLAMNKSHPYAKLAHLKSGGNFPFLSRPDQVNMHIRVHLRKFDGTKYQAKDSMETVVDNNVEYNSDSSL